MTCSADVHLEQVRVVLQAVNRSEVAGIRDLQHHSGSSARPHHVWMMALAIRGSWPADQPVMTVDELDQRKAAHAA